MRFTRSTLLTLIFLSIISAVSLGYLFFAPEQSNAENTVLRMKRAALRGDSESQLSYGTYCMVAENKDEEGFMWMKKSSDQGYAPAQYLVGVCYFDGQFVEKDVAKAIALYREAAIKGYASAQSRLADCYVYGWGVNKSTTEALKWYHLAALSGDTLAMNNIGSIYLHGDGVKEDYVEAYKWFSKAAICGNPGSQLTLGQMLSVGDGCEKDEVEAYAWLKIAAEEEADAMKELKDLRKKITAEQISNAMQRVKILQSKISELRQASTEETVSKN